MFNVQEENEGSRGVRYRLWQGAVPIHRLRETGMTDEMIKSLLAEGYVEHGVETTGPGAHERRFRWGGHLPFCNKSCFILMSQGATWAREFVARAVKKNQEAPGSPPTSSS